MEPRARKAATPRTTRISVRLPLMMLEELERLANERRVPLQALLQTFLAERVASEYRLVGRRRHVSERS